MTTCYRCRVPITWSGKGWSDDVEGFCREGRFHDPASPFGCGFDGCDLCYPFAYRCSDCGEDYPVPVPAREVAECANCGSAWAV